MRRNWDDQELCFDASAITNVTILDSTFQGACIDSSLLPTGIFDVVINNEDKKVWFSAEKRDEEAPVSSETILNVGIPDSVSLYESFNVTIELTNGLNKGHVYIVSLLDNKETIRELPIRLLPGETILKTEEIYLTESGNREITILLDRNEIERNQVLVTNNNIFSMPMMFLIGLVLLFLPSILIVKREKTDFPLVFAFSLSILVLLPSFLNLFGLNLSVFVPIFLILMVIMLARRD